MLKYYLLYLILLTSAVLPTSAAELRIIDAANGSPVIKILRETALDFVFSGDTVSMNRQLPSAESIKKILQNDADILVIDKRFLPSKINGAMILPLAAEALCLYIHPGNPKGSLNISEILEILTTARPVWKNHDGQKVDIQRIMLKSNIDGADIHLRFFGEKKYAPEIFRVSSPEQMFNFLNPAALGFAPFISGTFPQVEFMPVNDLKPDEKNIISGKYPLTLHYMLVCRQAPAPHIKKFIDSVRSNLNRRRMPEYGCIPLWEKKP